MRISVTARLIPSLLPSATDTSAAKFLRREAARNIPEQTPAYCEQIPQTSVLQLTCRARSRSRSFFVHWLSDYSVNKTDTLLFLCSRTPNCAQVARTGLKR